MNSSLPVHFPQMERVQWIQPELKVQAPPRPLETRRVQQKAMELDNVAQPFGSPFWKFNGKLLFKFCFCSTDLPLEHILLLLSISMCMHSRPSPRHLNIFSLWTPGFFFKNLGWLQRFVTRSTAPSIHRCAHRGLLEKDSNSIFCWATSEKKDWTLC